MGAFATIFGFIVSLALSLIIANAGAKRQIGFGWSLFWGIWLTPIVSLIAVLLSDKLQPDEYGRIEKRWGCLVPLIVSFLIVGTVAYIIYSYSNRSKQRIESYIETQVPQGLKSEPMQSKSHNYTQIQEETVPEVVFDESANSAYESLTKKGTNPANEIEVDLNNFLGTPDDGTDWNYTELSEMQCSALARQKIYYSESKGAWVKEKPSNSDLALEALKNREAAEREMKKQAQTRATVLNTDSITSRQILFKPYPSITTDIEGSVVIKVEINPNGKVVKCEIDNSSTINDAAILKKCTNAASKTKYNAIDSILNQTETIKYNFVIK